MCKLGQTGEEGELYFDFLAIDQIGLGFECFRSREDCISGPRSRRGVKLMGVGADDSLDRLKFGNSPPAVQRVGVEARLWKNSAEGLPSSSIPILPLSLLVVRVKKQP
jgi:hypothetical protein